MNTETTTRKMPPALAKALVAAQKRVSHVGKDAKNEFHNYKYASSEAVIDEASGALSEEGLAFLPLRIERDPAQVEHVWTGEGEDAWISTPRRMRAVYLLLHESGEQFEFESSMPVIPEKGRPEDKAEFGARTENLAYALRDLLLIPRLGEGGASGRNDTDDKGPRPPKQAQPPKQSEPPKAPPAAKGNGTSNGKAPPPSDPEHAEDVKKIKSCVGTELKWEAHKANEKLVAPFGVENLAKLSKAQASIALQLAFASVDGDEQYAKVLQTAKDAHPELFPQAGAAA